MHDMTSVTGDICSSKGAHLRYVTRSYGAGERLLVIENVPAVSCLYCGDSYMTADTLHEIERIKLHRKTIAMERQVSVAHYA